MPPIEMGSDVARLEVAVRSNTTNPKARAFLVMENLRSTLTRFIAASEFNPSADAADVDVLEARAGAVEAVLTEEGEKLH